jgi:demethylmenaquinone methyltransferase/2-methoxy-6-polyprenyl-1,4-benzoquinol methylase
MNSPAEKKPDTAWDDRLLADPHAVADKRRRVREMFAAIAPSYDLNNRLHSLGVDQLWRRKAVKLSQLKATDRVVDVACGTGDLSFAYLRRLLRLQSSKAWKHVRGHGTFDASPSPTDTRQVFGVDFTFQMLSVARKKTPVGMPYRYSDPDVNGLEGPPGRMHSRLVEAEQQGQISNGISWVNGDAQSLPMPDACADVVSIAFGIRNVQDPAVAFREFRRVLRPGGRVIVLEFSLPTNPILRALYNGYFRHVLPRTATLVSGDKTGAYKYLPESVNTFIGRPEMVAMMSAAGFENVEQFPMTFGVCVCYRGVVPKA